MFIQIVETRDDKPRSRNVTITGYTLLPKICFLIISLVLELSINRKISSFLHYPVIITGEFETAKETVSLKICRFFFFVELMYITVCLSVHRCCRLQVIK
jgi:hypothetical protein